MAFLKVTFILAAVGATFAAPAEDFIESLPGLNMASINFDQYSGYLNATTGRFLHYWFFESMNDPLTDPLLLWLNGGPGCSSLLGLFTELGPLYIEDDLSIGIMEYSWNRNASVIFIESPVCVGFSYDETGDCRSSDSSTSEQNYLALQHFFQKFPEYQGHDFYISGESFAGIYIPSLVLRIVNGSDTVPINLKGYAIGNGLLDYSDNDDSIMYFAHYHAIIDEPLWDELVAACCVDGDEGRGSCDFSENQDPTCQSLVVEATVLVYGSGINYYNIYGDCNESQMNLNRVTRESIDRTSNFRNHKIGPEPRSDPTCLEYDLERRYLNDPATKEAIHIDPLSPDWDVCASIPYDRELENVTQWFDLFKSNSLRALIYNGDVDMSVPFLGNQWEVEDLGWTVNEEQRTWWVDDQVAGWIKRFEGLDFVTVRGSGHMVPEDKPPQGFEMISCYLFNKTFPTETEQTSCIYL